MNKAWVCYEVRCSRELTEELAAWIGERLSVSVEITETGVRFYVERAGFGEEAAGEIENLLQDFRRAFGVENPLAFERSVLEGDDWANGWKAHFRPLKIGSRLIVCPSWERVVPAGKERVLHLDPGRAFGTGHHETTRLCLEWLDSYVAQTGERGAASLLDVGTGSGILAMGAALLGFHPVVGVDNDPEALEVAMENAQLNDLAHKVQFVLSGKVEVSGSFHIVMANIQAMPLMALAGALSACLDDSGKLVLSGILGEQKDQVRDAYGALGFELCEVREAGEWCLLVFERHRKDRI